MTMDEFETKRESQIGLSIIAVGQSWKRLFRQIMAEQGLSNIPVLPLSTLLQDGDGIRQLELAKRLGVENTAVVRVLDNLEKDGLVRREEDSSDRRAKLIYLTDEGRELAARIVGIRKCLREEILQDVSLEDVRATERLLAKVEAAVAGKLDPQK
ncbi:MarR family winged helix-turn-helix transcriptional regulator [Pseudodesulfovibrio sp.]|uniref:MarR family winged helix-turn-helix transcriptional regulator n=1 Tax=unclassified Pseudodesulfovibrio TaxID=2661612 RepID=UPI003B00A20C